MKKRFLPEAVQAPELPLPFLPHSCRQLQLPIGARVERAQALAQELTEKWLKKYEGVMRICNYTVGQFGGIAESLGYQTEYRDGYFRFRKDGEELSMSVSEIRK